MNFNKLIKDCFTGRDNQTIDVGRVLWVIGFFVFLGLCITEVIRGHDFKPLEYAGGMGTILACGGAALGFKRSTEPDITQGLQNVRDTLNTNG